MYKERQEFTVSIMQFNSGTINSLDLIITKNQKRIMQVGYLYMESYSNSSLPFFLLLRVIYACLLRHIYTFVFLNWSIGPGNIQIYYVWSHLNALDTISLLSLLLLNPALSSSRSSSSFSWLLQSCFTAVGSPVPPCAPSLTINTTWHVSIPHPMSPLLKTSATVPALHCSTGHHGVRVVNATFYPGQLLLLLSILNYWSTTQR